MRTRTEEDLRKSEEQFRLLVEGVKDYAIFMLDVGGHVVTWNTGAEHIKGYKAAEIIGRNFSCFYIPEDIARGLPQRDLQGAEAEGRAEEEGWRMRKDGSRFWANVVITALRDEAGRLRGFGKVTRDITERKRAEAEVRQLNQDLEQRVVARTAQLKAANKELEAFAYSVSHDLRAPLRGMDAFSQILQEKYAAHMDEDALHCLHMIRDNAKQMGRLIDDLLAFSRLSQLPLRKEPVQNDALVQAALHGLEAEQKGRLIELAIGELPAAEADPRLLKQVWVNLIANALKYTRGRDKTVIRIGSETKSGVPVYFVQDNGVGFDMRYAHKLFGVFQRLHRAEDYEGTGVGLAIAQRIIGRHGGRIWTQAAKGQGATFYFTLQGEDGHA